MNRATIGLLVVRIVAMVVSAWLGLFHPFAAWDHAITAALVSLAIVMLVHLAIDLVWEQLLKSGGMGRSPDIAAAWGPFVGLIVTTAGVVLGLLQAFGTGHLSDPLKVATMSLVATVMLGMFLFGLVVSAAPKGAPAVVFRAFIFNVTLWALALGLLSISWALVYR
jgi:hypothetical protein